MDHVVTQDLVKKSSVVCNYASSSVSYTHNLIYYYCSFFLFVSHLYPLSCTVMYFDAPFEKGFMNKKIDL